MIGAIFGDIAGSTYEFRPQKSKNFELLAEGSMPTDDTVMNIAVADALLQYDNGIDDLEKFKQTLTERMHHWGNRYPDAGYGSHFGTWLKERRTKPYNSLGNGAAMRVSPVGWYADTLMDTCVLARATAEITHDHPDGIKGAVVVAGAIFLARSGEPRERIRSFAERFYALDLTLEEIRPTYTYDVTAEGSVPHALQAFLEARDFEDAIRNAISLGGDSDTVAAITGAIAEAFFGITGERVKTVIQYLDEEQALTTLRFCKQYVTSLQKKNV